MANKGGYAGPFPDWFIKRAFDMVAVVLAAPLLLPLGLSVAVLVRWKIGGPVLFRQQRPGLHGMFFEILKFRTMTDERDADGDLLPDAERLTRFGIWLRQSSLDELPEFINVLRGEMSLVGPRPLLIEYLALYTPEQARRHEVLPGLTGWAQVKGRNELSWEQKFQLDTWYVDNRSFWLDLRIILLTVVKVLKREGISHRDESTMPRFTGKPD